MSRTNEQIAQSIAKDYVLTLSGENTDLKLLLEEAIRRGIVAKAEETKFDKAEWIVDLTERELHEVEFALYYIRHTSPTMQPGHGTDGHNRLVLISKFAKALGYTLTGATQLRRNGKNT